MLFSRGPFDVITSNRRERVHLAIICYGNLSPSRRILKRIYLRKIEEERIILSATPGNAVFARNPHTSFAAVPEETSAP